MCIGFFVDLLDQALQYGSRTAFREIVGSVSNHVLNGLCPAYGCSELSDKVCLDFSGISMRFGIYVLVDRTFGCLGWL